MYAKTKYGSVYYAYYTTSPRSVRTAVYLHGLGGDGYIWEFMREATLEAGFNYISLDLPGHGLSYRPGSPFAFEQLTGALEAIRLQEDLEHLTLVGHCLGGFAALNYTLDHPGTVERLILLNSSSRTYGAIKLLKTVLPMIRLVPPSAPKEHCDHVRFTGTHDLDLKRIASDLYQTGIRSYTEVLSSLGGVDMQSRLGTVRAQTFVIGGKKDIIFNLNHQRQLADGIPNAKFKAIDTNHISVINAREELRRVLTEELKRSHL